MDLLHYFEQETDFENNYWGDNYIEPWVSCTRHKVKYNKTEYEKLISMPLTFEMLETGSIVFTTNTSGFSRTITFSKNGGVRQTCMATTSGNSISVREGDVIQFYGNNSSYCENGVRNCTLNSSAKHKIKGNIMSLISESNFWSLKQFDSDYVFSYIFGSSTGLIDASELILPAEILTIQCYAGMFSGCSSLTTAPELPATTLASNCYRSMFANCTSLVKAPKLPATTLASSCYAFMFKNCTNLITAPELPATTLQNYCYQCMFSDCTSLVNVPMLPAMDMAPYCYGAMFQNCTSLTTAPELPAITLSRNCYSQMFYRCTSLMIAPILSAEVLVSQCYHQMFYKCSNLNYVKALFTTTPSSTYTSNWLSEVSSTGTFVKNSAATWNVINASGIPNGWTIETAAA